MRFLLIRKLPLLKSSLRVLAPIKKSYKLNYSFLLLLFLSIYSSSSFATKKNSYFSKLNIESYQYFKNGNYVEAYKKAVSAKKVATDTDNKIDLARSLSNIASVNLVLGDIEKALTFYLESYEISKKANDTIGLESTLNNLSGVYSRLRKFNEALEYLYLLPVLNNEERPTYQQVVAHNALILLLSSTNQFEKAEYYLNLNTKIFKQYDDPFSEFYFLTASAHFKQQQAKYAEALNYLEKAIHLAIDNKYKGAVVSALKNKTTLLIKLDEYDYASVIIDKALSRASELNLMRDKADLYQIKKDLALKQGNYKEALSFYEMANDIEEQVLNSKVKILGEVTRVERLAKETESKLIQSQKDQEILSLKLKQQSQNQLIWIITIIGGFVLIFLFSYRMVSKREIKRQRNVNKRLKELDRIKDRILKNTSHELRTPLNGIIGLSELLLEDKEDLDESKLDMIRLIKSSGEQLANVVNDILDMSQSKSGEITIVNAEFDLVEMIKDIVKVCSPLAIEKRIEIIFKQHNQEQLIFLDKTRLQQILFNIVGNAVKFTDKGDIKIQYHMEEFGVKITVSDTGIGIPSHKIERILEGFEQVDSGDTRKNSGSGLGLAISRNISLALGGKLEIFSEINQGTTISVTLPFA